MSTLKTSNEVVCITNEEFVSTQQLGFESKEVKFSNAIHWLLQSESTIRLMHGGVELKEGGTFTDFYGYLQSCSIDDLTKLADKFSVTPKSTLVIVMETRVFLKPVVLTANDIKHNKEKNPDYKSQFTTVPNDFRQKSKQTDAKFEIEFPFIYSSLEERDVATEVVWSTAKSEDENKKCLSLFKERYSVDAVSDSVNMSISEMLKDQ
tara:strand:- start:6729 stop:7349 length:621 start_codon:yes stop_codon:yes gene_type:complete